MSIADAESGLRRWVPGNTSTPEWNHVSLKGQKAWTPYGGLASAPSQSSGMCDDQASAQARPTTNVCVPTLNRLLAQVADRIDPPCHDDRENG